MKKLFTLLLATGIAAGASAQTSESVLIKKAATDKVQVAFADAPESTVFVKITDESDHLIFRDRIAKTEAFTKKYDLSKLDKGTYAVEVSDNSGVLSMATVENFEVEKPMVFTRVSKMDGDKYRLLVSSLDQNEVQVLIYDGGELIHTESVNNPQGMHKIFTIKKPSSEGISFKVKTASGFESFVTSL